MEFWKGREYIDFFVEILLFYSVKYYELMSILFLVDYRLGKFNIGDNNVYFYV